jgi:hypothetical protein
MKLLNMTETLNDETCAGEPGQVSLSKERLKALQPELFRRGGLDKLLGPVEDSKRRWWKTHCQEHLQHGDSRAAVVISVKPTLLVAAFTDELDCVALMRFPRRLVAEEELEVGSRLLTVNTYSSFKDQPEPAEDLILGPGAGDRWANVSPLIADFLTEDRARVAARKAEIPESEWARCQELGEEWHAAKRPARDGRPVLAHVPAPKKRRRRKAKAPEKLKSRGAISFVVLFVVLGALRIGRKMLRHGDKAQDLSRVSKRGVDGAETLDEIKKAADAADKLDKLADKKEKGTGSSMGKIAPQPSAKDEDPLVRMLRESKDPNLRASMVQALGMAEPNSARVAALSLALVDDASVRVRRAAAKGLLGYGKAAKPALANLRLAASDPDEQVRHFSRKALANLGVPIDLRRRLAAPRRGTPPPRPRRRTR